MYQPIMKFTAKDIAKALNVHDLFMALTYHGMPDMAVKTYSNGFMLVPGKIFINKAYDKDYESWQYAFVNRDKCMYKMLFESFDDLLETLFAAKEICYGAYPRDAQPNPLYGKSLEQLKIENELLIEQ